ncbi:hypothetical protein TNCV_4588001 [Trichonephila clavipes]|uniref:Uncharacterized protein n=1 Tax=Trichonephila clavipes TaxID=2585209 RepID=A0A8X6V8G2_TRICX|nr:hypothetical protein TNCV_4588001 [Trichonephila clavipes]
MSLSSFRVHQAATGHRVVPRRKKSDEHPPPSVCGRMSLSSFRVHQDTTGQQSRASTEKMTNTLRRAAAVGCRCHRSACNKTQPDTRVLPRRKKGTNTNRRASAVGCPCHRSACTMTRQDSRVVPRRKR